MNRFGECVRCTPVAWGGHVRGVVCLERGGDCIYRVHGVWLLLMRLRLWVGCV